MIKFRGINVKTSEEIIGSLVINSGHTYIVTYINPKELLETEIAEVHSDSVAMFTTKLDKDKKEIFGSVEINGKMSKGGDVAKLFETELDSIIIFYNGAFGYLSGNDFISFDQNKHFNFKDNKSNDIEIIGNQYNK